MPLPVAAASPATETAVEPETVMLTEPAGDVDLFEDPSLDVTRMADGEEREIVVPVELGDDRRRFKLSIRLRLDSAD